MKKLSLLMLGFVFLQNHAIKAADIIPMSPNASSLAMYADYPVSYYTGIPEINIPLYEINVDGFKLPISLSYHSNGILYNQEASWVGLGWTLNTGGAISRTIRDADDFMFGSSNNSKTGCYLSNADLSNPDPNNKNMFYTSTTVSYTGLVPLIDTQPDIFYYNLPGLSGKFLFNSSHIPVLFNKDHNLRIEYDNTNNCFKLTTLDGCQYIFNVIEKTAAYSKNGSFSNIYSSYDKEIFPDNSQQTHITSWLLSQIITPHNRTISFSYYKEGYKSPTQMEQEHYSIVYDPNNGISSCPSSVYEQLSSDGLKSILTEYYQNNFHLTKITWDGGAIVFNTSDRIDMIPYPRNGTTIWVPPGNPQKLDQINIYDNNNNFIKGFKFSTDYFNNILPASNQYYYLYNRLKLNNVVEVDESGNALNNGYSFSYSQEATLPSKNTGVKRDYWGYCNPYTVNTCNCDAMYISYKESIFTDSCYTGLRTYPGKDFGGIFAGMLTSINYPTGESCDFSYELNTFALTDFIYSTECTSDIEDIDKYRQSNEGGGLRIAQIKSGNKIRKFRYPVGKLITEPIFAYYKANSCSWNGGGVTQAVTYFVQLSRPTLPLTTLRNGNSVGYDYVREYISDGKDTSMTEYQYYNEAEKRQDLSYPFLPAPVNFNNGLLKQIAKYNNQTLVQKVQYNYENVFPTQTIFSFICNLNRLGYVNRVYQDNLNISFYNKTSETTTNFFHNIDNALQKVATFGYNSNDLLNSEKSVINSNTYENRTFYSSDYGDAVSNAMTSKNMIGIPIEKITLKNDQVVFGQKTVYQQTTDGLILPQQEWKLNTTAPLSQSNYFNNYTTQIYYDKYNAYGNLLQLRTLSSTTVYLWSYNGQYPVAEIKNATYSDVAAVLTESFITNLSNESQPTASDIAQIDALRTSLSSALITTYTYQSLVGMVTATDARGLTTTYTYDEFKRLYSVKDYAGQLLKDYTYHYKQ